MRIVRDLFGAKASRVIRCLLTDVGREWTVRELATAAGVAVGYCHAVLTTLDQMGFILRNERYKLVAKDPKRLLRRWAAYRLYDRENTFLDYYTFEREIDVVIRHVARSLQNEHYALTTLAGAWLIAPQVRPVDIHLYVESRAAAKALAEKLAVRATAGTGNIRLVVPNDVGVFYGAHSVGEVKVVSLAQLFVDLFNYPARGEEAAAALLQHIEKEWAALLVTPRRV